VTPRPAEATAAELVRQARGRHRPRSTTPLQRIASREDSTRAACRNLRLWLDELARNCCLDFAGEHCVGEALRDLAVVQKRLRRLRHELRLAGLELES
jgi:hypothetical protein